MKVRLRVIDEEILERDRDRYFLCVAKDRVDPNWSHHGPQLRPAILEQWDEHRGGWFPIEIEL